MSTLKSEHFYIRNKACNLLRSYHSIHAGFTSYIHKEGVLRFNLKLPSVVSK